MKLNSIRFLIFDLDGTLVDTSSGVVQSVNATLKFFGEPPRTDREIIKFIGFPLLEMFSAFSSKPYNLLWQKFQELGKDVITESAIAIDGVTETLVELRKRGYRLGIGTTKIHYHLEKIVRKFSWQETFEALVGADDVSRVKPHPDAFLKAMAILNGSETNTLIVGDTINDILAAKAASLPVALVESPYGNSDYPPIAAPDLKLKRISDLLSLLP